MAMATPAFAQTIITTPITGTAGGNSTSRVGGSGTGTGAFANKGAIAALTAVIVMAMQVKVLPAVGVALVPPVATGVAAAVVVAMPQRRAMAAVVGVVTKPLGIGEPEVAVVVMWGIALPLAACSSTSPALQGAQVVKATQVVGVMAAAAVAAAGLVSMPGPAVSLKTAERSLAVWAVLAALAACGAQVIKTDSTAIVVSA